VPISATSFHGSACRPEILRRRAHLTPDVQRDPVYTVDSLMWSRLFEAEHDA
jgi:hypothetical protein